jgi:alpha-tubulin suppressor-like RCC1 family protein
MKKKLAVLVPLVFIMALWLLTYKPSAAADQTLEATPTATETPPVLPTAEDQPGPMNGLEEDPNHLAERLYDYGPSIGGSEKFSTIPLLQNPKSVETPFHATMLAAGLSYTCAASNIGGVKCWGDNYRGRLGDGSGVDHFTPVYVNGLTYGVKAISSSHKHTCVLTESGGVKCWGYNLHGELGNGTTIDSLIPIDVPGLTSGVLEISAGGFHTCALLDTGHVMCWGANWHGQTGVPMETTPEHEIHSPVEVPGLSNVTAIRAGKYHTCAIVSGGALYCWGYNFYGQIGNGVEDFSTKKKENPVPFPVIGLQSDVVDVSLGGLHTCALLKDGRVYCWGDNSEGQLGNDTHIQQLRPFPVSGLGVGSGVTHLSAGGLFTCALIDNGTVQCWGDDWAGQIGDGANTNNDRLIPTQVEGLEDAVFVETGDSHACAARSSGEVVCWGSNATGQIGDGSAAIRLTPVAISSLNSGVAFITVGAAHACVITNSGGVKCWGNNKYGQLGDGTYIDRLTPVDVVGINNPVISLSAGEYHTCAVSSIHSLVCWGYNGYGQLGNSTRNNSPYPVLETWHKSYWTSVAAGGNHTCATLNVHTAYGNVRCWGRGHKGQLGYDTNKGFYPAPMYIENGVYIWVTQLAAGEDFTCALTGETAPHRVVCWGNNHDGELGDGTTIDRSTYARVSGLNDNVLAITAGVYHACAILNDGTNPGAVRCWGANYTGQIGDGSVANRLTATDVIGLSGPATAISAGGFHTCALSTGSELQCWGDNSLGQLGINSIDQQETPQTVNGYSGVLARIGAGMFETCGLTNQSEVFCWGSDSNGQIGDGSLPWRTIAQKVIGLNTPELNVNYNTGGPGSTFSFVGADFLPNQAVTVTVNGYVFPQALKTDGSGGLTFRISTGTADAGIYIVTARSTTMIRSSRFVIELGGDLRPPEGSGAVFDLPAGIAFEHSLYLAVVNR